MKIIYIKAIILLAIIITTGNTVKAQTENTNERLITRLKNGTVPGWQFSTERPVATPVLTDKKINEKESLIMQIRKGTAPGMQFKPVAAGGSPVTAPALRAATTAPRQPLPSEQPMVVTPVKQVAVMVPKQE